MNKMVPCLVLLLSPGLMRAGEVDKTRLRQLVRLPTISTLNGTFYSSTLGFYMPGEKPDAVTLIDQIRRELKGDATDLDRYQRLSDLYYEFGKKKEAEEANTRALALCRQQVKERPKDMAWLAQLGGACSTTNSKPKAKRSCAASSRQPPANGGPGCSWGKPLTPRPGRLVWTASPSSSPGVPKLKSPGNSWTSMQNRNNSSRCANCTSRPGLS